MERALLNSEEEYFDLCKSELIGDVSKIYFQQYCYIEYGIPCNVSYVCGNGYYKNETLHIKTKPASYPCMFVWHLEEDRGLDCIDGQFIYEKDFKE